MASDNTNANIEMSTINIVHLVWEHCGESLHTAKDEREEVKEF